MKNILVLISLLFVLAACGDPDITLPTDNYKPKITVQAYIFPGEYVKNIRIMRNFPIGQEINPQTMFLTPEQNSVKVTINNIQLDFDPVTKTYYSMNILVKEKTTYTIEISAQLEGKSLKTMASTTTPEKGFKFLVKNLGTIAYTKNKPYVNFTTSPGVDFYALSIMADSAKVDNFIYENTFLKTQSREDVEKSFNNYKFQSKFFANLQSEVSKPYLFSIEDYDYWFYSPYTVIGYAGDVNFRSFALSAGQVQEFDGNFHEPIRIFNNDGIGVFASAIKDTLKFKVVK